MTRDDFEISLGIGALEGQQLFVGRNPITREHVVVDRLKGQIIGTFVEGLGALIKPAKTMESGLNFGKAVEAVKQGKLISREGWNGKGMFVFMRPEVKIDAITLVQNVGTFPEAGKKWMEDKKHPNDPITFTAYLCMKAADDTIVNGWLASQTDILAEDWCIL